MTGRQPTLPRSVHADALVPTYRTTAMGSAYPVPLCISCAAPMAREPLGSLSLSQDQTHLSNPFLYGPDWFKSRVPSFHSSLSVARKRRRRRTSSSTGKVSCAFSDAPEVVTACSWNEAVLCSDVPVLVEFWASWCGPCRMVHRVIDEIAREYAGRIKCFKLDADDHPQVAASHNIERIPTVLLYKNGEQLQSFTGTLPKSVFVTAIEKSLSQ